MTSPLPLPDWVPWWMHIAILLAVLLFGLMFVLMPFSVFGVKARLEAIDARLDEIQGEIRSLSLRLPEPGASDFDDIPFVTRSGRRPPIPPAPVVPTLVPSAQVPSGRGPQGPQGGRTEPRLY
ncbi:MAG: hypothetical protein NVSMB18_20660 [Acetobacteraceae bacterium]